MNNKFCIWCGSALEENAEYCTHCGKTQPQKENQLVDWLVDHTKNKVKDDVESSVFEAIKGFLMSHIYGTVVSLAVVAAIGVTAYANPAYIKETTADKYYSEMSQQVFNPSQELSGAYDSQANSSVHDIVMQYLMYINSDTSVEGLVVPAGFGYSGSMEVQKDMRFEQDGGLILNGQYERTEFSPDYFSLPLSVQLASDGYRVGECVAQQTVEDSSGNVVYHRSMLFGCVETQNGWRIFESKMLSLDENPMDDIVLNLSDDAEIQSVVANFMYDTFHLGEYDENGNIIGTDEETYWYPGYQDAYREVGVDGRVREGEGRIKTVYIYMPMFEYGDFSLDVTKLMQTDGVVVAECYVEEFLDDAATGENIGYRRTLHSLTKSEYGWRIFENRVEQLIEYNVINSNHVIDSWQNGVNDREPYVYEIGPEQQTDEGQNSEGQVIDPVSIASFSDWIYDYIEVLFTGDEGGISRRHSGIYYTTVFESSYYLQTLPQQLNGKTFHQTAIDSFTTDISAMGYPPQIFEQQDYQPVQMDVTVEIVDNDGKEIITKNRLLLIFVDGEYRLADDVQI